MPEMGTNALTTAPRPSRRKVSSAREDTPTSLVAALLRVAWEVATRVENLMEAR